MQYLFKGSKREKLRLTNADDIDDDDEINIYLRGRILVSMDCMWRTLGYETYPAPQPAVMIVKVTSPDDMQTILNKNQINDLYVYFNRPRNNELQYLKYCEFYKYYRYDTKLPRYAEQNSATYTSYEVTLNDKRIFIYKRKDPDNIIVRLNMLYMNAGDIWYLRQLLIHRSDFYSYDDLKTWNGTPYATFQEAAKASGIIENEA